MADLLRDSFKRAKYPDVILPLTVLRRLDCVLEPTKAKVLETHAKLKGRLENLAPQLCKASGFAFYNTSQFTFERLLQDHAHLAANLRAYINGFSDNMREVLEKFDFGNTISKLDEAGLLFLVLEKFKNIDLHPDKVSNLEMGYVFEELLRKFNEAMDENPGEHFTPREVVRLMVALILSHDHEALHQPGIVRTVSDPCSGTGGMLTLGKDRILEINPQAQVHLFGQEVNPETYAVCKSDLYMKSLDGKDAENIKFGSTLARDAHGGLRFDYQLANPPYGKEWKIDQKAVEAEHERGHAGRFGAGLPRISDGQLLFLCHMLNRMKPREEGGGRVAIVMNGSPLFTGDAGSGESEIRRWILENDWLEAIVALPEQLFYNTGIPTYVWVLSNNKPAKRKGKVQLIDATSFWSPMRKSLGSKRREITADQIGQVTQLFERFKEGEHCQDLPHHRVRLPQDHRRASPPAQLPGQPRADRAAPDREGVRQPGHQQEEARQGARCRGRRGDRAPAGDPEGPEDPEPGQAPQEPARIPGRAERGPTSVQAQTPRPRPQGHPVGPVGAGRDRRDLHRREGEPRG